MDYLIEAIQNFIGKYRKLSNLIVFVLSQGISLLLYIFLEYIKDKADFDLGFTLKGGFTDSYYAWFFTLLGLITFIFVMFRNQVIHKLVEHSNMVKATLSDSRIVFESSIKDFDEKHVRALESVLHSLSKKDVKYIYAIDNSDAYQWWSDSMTGYTALLSKWKNNYAFEEINNLWKNGKKNKSEIIRVPFREVYRIFVYSKDELYNPVAIKTLTFHAMLGFRTYIFRKDYFDYHFKEFTKAKRNKDILQKKEVLIWNNPKINTANFKDWEKITCYLSFWDLDMEKSERDEILRGKKEHIWKNYHNDIPEIKVDVLFDFIPKKSLKHKKDLDGKDWPELPAIYLAFIEYLIGKSICVKDADQYKSKVNGKKNFGVEIKTRPCSNCTYCDDDGTKFETVSNETLRRIVTEYVKS